ncbi:YbaB/EbfC family nucleoid-associated protein [Nocardia camponoti]|uniref:YbaB/EbfC family DNA-binding protein n=1 Tax=Nocardia camponoti TaxID=1616106 RepID=A0A917QTW3_9NOCA|nr:YbaB/EbfC family nucleoid-associated protein [Nocardia camponoti]GGK67441.1 hypothetical protein GCM10011591_44500 [Nocardia camponoti]
MDELTFALSEQRISVADPTGCVTVEVTADGAIRDIRLSDAGQRMLPQTLVELIVSLHARGLARAREAIEEVLLADMPDLGTPDSLPGADAEMRRNTDLAPADPPSEARTVGPGSLDRDAVRTAGDGDPDGRAPDAPVDAAVPDPAPNRALPVAPLTRARRESIFVPKEEDEGEYFRNFSVFAEDNHRPRLGR